MTRFCTLLLLLASCGRVGVELSQDSKSPKSVVVEEGGGSGDIRSNNFATALWPMLNKRCGSCHATTQAPFFASTDVVKAEQGAKDKINVQNIMQSRLVQRLVADKHNCWDECANNAEEMFDAVSAYVKSIKGKSEALTTSSIRISSVYPEGTTLIDANRTADLKAPTELKVEGKIPYLTAPNVPPQAATNAPQLTGEIKIEMPPQSTAYVAFYCRGSTKTPLNLIVETTTVLRLNPDCGADWGWTVATPTAVSLTSNAFRIQGVTNAIQIARIAVARNPNAVARLADLSLEYDISSLIGFEATFKATISPFDARTMKISQLSIKTDQPLHIKGIKPLVNGSFDPIHATYLNLEQDVSAPGGIISESALILKADFEKDELSFGFEEIR
jgi:hypothetical protein